MAAVAVIRERGGLREAEHPVLVALSRAGETLDGSSEASRRTGLALLRAGDLVTDDEWAALLPHRDHVRRNHRGLDIGRVRIEIPAALVDVISTMGSA